MKRQWSQDITLPPGPTDNIIENAVLVDRKEIHAT